MSLYNYTDDAGEFYVGSYKPNYVRSINSPYGELKIDLQSDELPSNAKLELWAGLSLLSFSGSWLVEASDAEIVQRIAEQAELAINEYKNLVKSHETVLDWARIEWYPT